MMVCLATKPPRCARRGDVMATSDNKTADTDEKIFIGKGEQTAWLDACARQSARSRHRSDRNRQDRVAAGDGGRVCARRCSRVRGRYQGRPVRDLRSRRGQGLHPQARRRDGPQIPARPVLDRVLGRVRRAGPSGPRHRHGNGAVAAVADARSERRAGRRAQCRIPRGGRKRPDADRHEGSAGAVGCDRAGRRQEGAGCRGRPARRDPKGRAELRQCQQGNRRNHSAPASGAGKPGRQRNSSASRR